MYGLKVISPPAEEPVTLERAKRHLRVDLDDEDDDITESIKAARKYAEEHAGRFFMNQTVQLKLSCWPADGVIRLAPFGPNDVTSIAGFTYADVNGDTQNATNYQSEFSVNPPIIAPEPGYTWPTLESGRLYPIEIDLTVGAANATVLDPRIGRAVLLILGYWDQDRGDAKLADVAPSLGLPLGAKRLLDQVWTGAYVTE